ncbi:MAG: glycosyltransferase family 39 protein [Bacteroidota bacterium]
MLSLIKKDKWFFAFLVSYIVISCVGMALTPLFDEDEGFFAEASRNMLANNDFVVVSVNGEIRYDKPALFFWFTAISLKIFGINEFAARLPSFLFFLIYTYLIFGFAKKYFSTSSAKISVIIAVSILQFQVLSRAAVSDNLLNLCVALALFSVFDFFQNPNFKSLFWLYTASGLGFLTKGPIAILMIGGVIFFYILFQKKWSIIKKLFNPVLIVWSILIPFPWFYLAYLRSGDFLFYNFIIKHNVGRFSQTMESHGGHLWYYFPVLILSFLPFIHLIFSVIKKLHINHKVQFLIIWFLLPFVLFSFSKTQLPHYISIGYFPFIILISQAPQLKEKYIFVQISLLIIAFLVAPLLIGKIVINDEFVTEMLKNAASLYDKFYLLQIFILLLFSIIVWLYSKQKLIVLILIFIVATNIFIYKFAVLQQGFVKQVGRGLYHSKSEIFMADHYNPTLSFYAQKVFAIKNNPQKGDLIFRKVATKKMVLGTLILKGNGYVLLKE